MEHDKTTLIEELLTEIKLSLAVATRAANDAKDLATHEQSKPETQYDTVGLEASYLAHGQSQRVAELKLALMQWQALSELAAKDTVRTERAIEFGCLIQLENEEAEAVWFLLGPAMGGLKLKHNDKLITVVTESSPLGKAIMGRYIDDEINLSLQGKNRLYEIIGVY
jgi:transcription elongation GreA/GreB family factor